MRGFPCSESRQSLRPLLDEVLTYTKVFILGNDIKICKTFCVHNALLLSSPEPRAHLFISLLIVHTRSQVNDLYLLSDGVHTLPF